MLPSLLFSILTLFSRGWGGGLIERGGWLLQKLAAKVALIREGGLDRAFMENSLLKQYMGNREWMVEGGVMLFSATNWGWVSRFYAHERVESSVLRWTFTFPHAPAPPLYVFNSPRQCEDTGEVSDAQKMYSTQHTVQSLHVLPR